MLPRVEGSHHILLLSPSPEVFDDLIDYYCVFFVAFLEIFLDFIGVRSFSHQTISNRVDLIVALTRDFFSDVFDVVVVPVLFFIDVGKGCLEGVEFASFYDGRKIVLSWDEPCTPFVKQLSFNDLYSADLGV